MVHSTKRGFIPKRAEVMNNVWGIHMDPARHPSPRTVNPDRYHDYYQGSDEPGSAETGYVHLCRPSCPDIHFAERSLFLGMPRIRWGFDIALETDDAGSPILPDPDRLTQGFVYMPEEFPRITPMSKERADLVMSEWKQAEEERLDPKTRQQA